LLLVSEGRCEVDPARVSVADAAKLRTPVQRSRAGGSGRVSGQSRRRQAMRFAITALLIAASLVIVPRAQTSSDAWRTYGGNVQGWRYSELTQIDVRNVARLSPRWIYQIGVGRGFETTPLVFGGLMFIAGPSNNSWALDAKTGRPIWHYRRTPPSRLNLCCGEVN